MQMQISRKADFALRIIGFLASLPDGRVSPLAEIAEREHVPANFLETVMRPLVHNGYVKTAYGPDGGYRIARDPYTVTFKEVIEAVDGPIAVHECIPFEGACGRADCCYQIPIWREIQEVIENALSQHTVGELIHLVNRASVQSVVGEVTGS
ncbi:MAG: Rrf2 family transcriptional regulator [Candidatus Tectomicrobia bacterium]|nr:Rrf2 family transcriptional regulator [Candidatus Tectomicrobia bacterium]